MSFRIRSLVLILLLSRDKAAEADSGIGCAVGSEEEYVSSNVPTTRSDAENRRRKPPPSHGSFQGPNPRTQELGCARYEDEKSLFLDEDAGHGLFNFT